MQEFWEIFAENNRKMSKVILDHHLWGRQTFICDRLQIINDSERLGVVIKGQEKYVNKRDIIYVNENSVSDGTLTIIIQIL